MKSLPTFLLAAFTTLAIGMFAGCGNTTYEIYPKASSVGGDATDKDLSAEEPVVTAPSGENDGSEAESLAKIKDLEAKIDELNQKIAEQKTAETPKTPDPTPDPKPTPIADPKPDDQAPLPSPEDSTTYVAATDFRAEADLPKKKYSVADAVAYSIMPRKDGGPVCGDGLWHPAEECDDGNQQSGDGCFDCRTEAGWDCDGGSDMTPCWPKQ